jgi:uncharacterized protein YukE
MTAVDVAGAASAAPQTFVIPRVHGDPAAARRLAASYRSAADELAAVSTSVGHVVAELNGSWRGGGYDGSAHPLSVLRRNAATTVRALHETADGLEAYAHKLEAAHHHHWFSLHKVLAVAAVVTITAAAVVVTMGAAAAAEAALAASAAGEATAAAGAAAAAGSGAAAGLLESTVSLAGVRALLAFAVPHLVQAELSAGFAASLEETADGRLDWHEIGVAAGAGFVGSAGAGQAARVAEAVKLAERVTPWLRVLFPHLAQAAAWTGADAGEQVASNGTVSWRELLLTGGLAGAGSGTATLRATVPSMRVAAFRQRQTLDELLAGHVDLAQHEGADLGHTLLKHVNVSDADLWNRIVTENRREASRFFDLTTAEQAVSDAMRIGRDQLERLRELPRAKVRVTLPYIVGRVMTADGELHPTRQVVIWLRRDAEGVYISSAYPELAR